MHISITGASSGIGESLARSFGHPGNKLSLIARRKELLDTLSASLGGCYTEARDLSDEAQATAWLEGAQSANGPIDVLINNAGMENTGPIEQVDLVKAAQLMRLNLLTPIQLIHAVLPQMLARRSGVIVNVVSMAALAPLALQAWYSASKGGLANFSEALHSELRGSGVHVVTVYPGPVTTAMGDSAYAAFGGRKGIAGIIPEGKPDKLAALVLRAVERKKARIIYPSFYQLGRWFPVPSRWLSDTFGPRPYKK